MRRPMLGKAIQNWYPQDSRNDPKVIRGLHLAGVYTDENLQYKEWRRDYMIARGKPPVQKGKFSLVYLQTHNGLILEVLQAIGVN